MSEVQPPSLEALQDRLGYRFLNEALLEQALTHKSFSNERSGSTRADNERLEFLGDAVLDLALTAELMQRFPEEAEGVLSKKRASLVNEDHLAKLALGLAVEKHLKLGKGELKTGGLQKPRLLASALEAILGAVFLDGGFAGAQVVVSQLLAADLSDIDQEGRGYGADYKTRLQELMQDVRRQTPVYFVESETGPDHDKEFTVSVKVGGETLATGRGKSKKAAEQDAAQLALLSQSPAPVSLANEELKNES
jgi:ribonuclease-3